MKKESKEEAVARLGAWNPTVPDSLKDMKDLVRAVWSDNIRLIDEVRKLRYEVAELKYDNAMLKAEPKAKGEVK